MLEHYFRLKDITYAAIKLLSGQARSLHPAVLVLGVLFIVKFAVA